MGLSVLEGGISPRKLRVCIGDAYYETAKKRRWKKKTYISLAKLINEYTSPISS